jgi:hypothetical protein
MRAKFHIYIKKHRDKKYVRTELMQEKPDCTIKEFMSSYVEQVVPYKFERIISSSSLFESSSSEPQRQPQLPAQKNTKVRSEG